MLAPSIFEYIFQPRICIFTFYIGRYLGKCIRC